MLEKISEAIAAIHRVPTQLLLVLGISVGVILLVSDEVALALAVDTFRTEYRVYLGPVLVIISAWLFARFVAFISSPIRERLNLRKLAGQLSDLTPDEKGYLAPFILNGETTIHVSMDDGIIGGLRARGIVYRSSSVFNVLDGVPYNLQPWARDHLSANPDLLQDAGDPPLSPRDKLGLRRI